jgi:hypothetical protein
MPRVQNATALALAGRPVEKTQINGNWAPHFSPGIAWNEIQPVRYLLESFSSLSPLAAAIWDDLCFQRA